MRYGDIQSGLEQDQGPGAVPACVYNMAEEGQQECESLDFLPENLRNSLLDFQKDGVKFAIRNQGRCLIGDEMGLGKTLQALSVAYYYKDEWPLLVVVPSSVKYPWIEEVEKWLTDLEPGDINLIRSGTDISNIPTSKISILGYGLCCEQRSSKLLVNALNKQAFKVVVLDESHYVKNRTAARTKILHPICKSSARVILLTGTPSLARPEELYVQLDMVRPGEFGSFSNFANRYCEAHFEYFGKICRWNTRGACNLDELHKRLHNGIMIRRLKKNVLTQLPPKRRQKITFDLPDSEHKQDLFQAKDEFKHYHKTLKDKETLPQQKTQALFELGRLSTLLYHYTGLAKAGSVQQYISDLLDGMDNKFIVFCRHKKVIAAVIQKLATKNVQYICIDGSVPSAARGSLVNQFQTDPRVRVAALAIEAASFGLTLTAADHVVFAELHFTPGVMVQAEDRAHRIGQENAVNVHYLVARGTLDEVLWAMIRRKIYVTSSALDGKREELQAEDGDEETSKQLSICEAWLNDESGDNDDSSDYLFSQTSKKVNKQIKGQRDLRSFFSPSTKDVTLDSEVLEISASLEKTTSSSPTSAAVSSPAVVVEDSGEEETVSNEVPSTDGLTSPVPKENDSKIDNSRHNTTEVSEPHTATPCLATSSTSETKITDQNCVNNHKENNASLLREDSWSCEACTFINDPQMSKCSVCRTIRTIATEELPSHSTSELDTLFSRKTEAKVKKSKSLKKRAKLWKERIHFDDSDVDDFIEPVGRWSCLACTFLNDAMLIECSMCMTPRRRSQRQTNSAWSTKSCEKRRRASKKVSVKRKRVKDVEKGKNVTDARTVDKTEHEKKDVFCSSTVTLEKQIHTKKRLQLQNNDLSADSELNPRTLETLGDEGREQNTLSTNTETRDSPNKEHQDESGILENSASINDSSKHSQNLFSLELSDSGSTDKFDGSQKEPSANVQHVLEMLSTPPTSSSLPVTDCEENENMADITERHVHSVESEKEQFVQSSETKDTKSEDQISTQQSENLLDLQQTKEELIEEGSEMTDFDLLDYHELTSNAGVSSSKHETSNVSLPVIESSEKPLESSLSPTESDEIEINRSGFEKRLLDPPKPVQLRFALSTHTDRVYLYDKNERFLNCSFLMSDVMNSDTDDLPYILRLDSNFKQAKRMVQLYGRLGIVQKRLLSKSKLVFQDPVEAYQLCKGTKEPSKIRHTNKDLLLKHVKETAQKTGGDVRLVSRSPERKRQKRTPNRSPETLRKPTEQKSNSSKDEVSCFQAFGPEGTPLCLFCIAPVEYGSVGNDWDCRFCSYDCKENYQIRTSNTVLRRKLFDSEKGICQQCHFDAHACYYSFKSLQKKDRRAFLEKSIYADLPTRILNRMILEPKEGQFWEADHIVAVIEGGGECGLENLRTLCVPCHKKETKKLLSRLKTSQQQSNKTGSKPISEFLETKKLD